MHIVISITEQDLYNGYIEERNTWKLQLPLAVYISCLSQVAVVRAKYLTPPLGTAFITK